jgi:hypothetical protein
MGPRTKAAQKASSKAPLEELPEPAAAAPPKVRWSAHAGAQELALAVDGVFELLYGGARGGGKTEIGMAWLLKPPHFGNSRFRALVLRRNYDDLSDWIDRAERFYAPVGGRVIASGPPRVVFESGLGKGAIFRLGHLKDKNTYTKYQGHEYQRLIIEEVQQITTEQQYELLLGSVRSTLDGVAPAVYLTANPGGIGHLWLKERFGCGRSDPRKPRVAYRMRDGRLRMYIPATVDDNPTLREKNPEYIAYLEALPEPFRSAWRYGDWDIYIGQAFEWTSANVIDPVPIPESARIIMTFDEGFGKPFSVGWWWVTGDKILVRIGEWYGCVPGQPDMGLRMADPEVARGILEREERMGIAGRVATRLADPTCFNKRPDHTGGGQTEALASTFQRCGVLLRKGDPARSHKFRQFVARVKTKTLLVFSTCKDFLRTVPDLPLDEISMGDVDTDAEDHIYDEACHACMEVPLPDSALLATLPGGAAMLSAAIEEDRGVGTQVGRPSNLLELLEKRLK